MKTANIAEIKAHFSKFIRPDAKVIGLENTDSDLMAAAAQNPDGSIAVVVFNEGKTDKSFSLSLGDRSVVVKINKQAIQTIIIPASV